jgi:hypothetical protein
LSCPRDAELLIAEGWAALVDTANEKPARRSRKARNGGPALS